MQSFWQILRNIVSPQPSSSQQVRTAFDQAAAASATIIDGYGHVGTSFSIHYRDNNYLITSAHLTTNVSSGPSGFSYPEHFVQADGSTGTRMRAYFPIIRNDGTVALAQHLIVNPQGGPCHTDGQFQIGTNLNFRDLSVLRVLPPSESQHMLENICRNSTDRAQLLRALHAVPSLHRYTNDGHLDANDFAAMTRGFHLAPIAIHTYNGGELMGGRRTPSLFSVDYHTNQPAETYSSLDSDYPPRTEVNLRFRQNPATPIVGGHSGSMLFDILPSGTIRPVGVVTGADCSGMADAVNFQEVLRGIDFYETHLRTHRAQSQAHMVNLPAFCAVGANGRSSWMLAESIGPERLPAPHVSAPNKNTCPGPHPHH